MVSRAAAAQIGATKQREREESHEVADVPINGSMASRHPPSTKPYLLVRYASKLWLSTSYFWVNERFQFSCM